MITKQYKGFLEIDGLLDLDQYWPKGFHSPTKNNLGSDADTVKIKVDPSQFHFTSANGKKKQTSVFVGAYIRAKKSKSKDGAEKITPSPVVSKSGVITIRLQATDSPELHYSTATKGVTKIDYRQNQGENATTALVRELESIARKVGKRTLRCRFFTWVDKPGDVCDSNGRFIGDVRILEWGGGIVIGDWLLKSGWAVPSLYESMSVSELDRAVASWKSGSSSKGLVKSLSSTLGKFNPSLVIRSGGKKDSGSFVFPKIFRRQAKCFDKLGRSGQFTPEQFITFLKGTATSGGNQDMVYDFNAWKHFLQNPKSKKPSSRPLYSLIQTNGHIRIDPAKIIIKEAKSSLKGANGKKVTSW